MSTHSFVSATLDSVFWKNYVQRRNFWIFALQQWKQSAVNLRSLNFQGSSGFCCQGIQCQSHNEVETKVNWLRMNSGRGWIGFPCIGTLTCKKKYKTLKTLLFVSFLSHEQSMVWINTDFLEVWPHLFLLVAQ